MPRRRTRAAVDVLGSIKHLLLRFMPWIDEAWATHRDTGLRFRVRPRDAVGRTIMRRRAYEPQVTDWLLANLGKGNQGIFVDVGANLGWFTLQAARHERVQRVVAIEPDAVNHGLLQANISRNPSRTPVDAVLCALGAASGLARLQRYKGSNLGRHSLLKDYGHGGSWVPIERLDELLQRMQLAEAPIAAMKIDVEGYEPLVLAGAGAALARTQLLLIELSPQLSREGELDLPAAINAIAAAGFVPDACDRGSQVPTFEQLLATPEQVTVAFRRVAV